MATQPVLAGYTLPHTKKDGYSESRRHTGAWSQMANGAWVFDAVGGANNHTISIRMEWAAISTTEKNTIRDAFNALFTNGSGAMTTPENLTYTVIIDPQSTDFECPATVKAGGTLVWNCRLSLLKVA